MHGPATAELTWGLILALLRKIPSEDAAMRLGGWQNTIGGDLAGATLGLLGLGRLGKRMAPVAQAFGMEVLAWSQNLDPEEARAAGAEPVEKLALFERADIVSVHYKLSERSRGLVGAAELAAMKPSAYLVNTSRGPIVDTDALVAALHAGEIAGAGIDVYDTEPLPADHPLRKSPAHRPHPAPRLRHRGHLQGLLRATRSRTCSPTSTARRSGSSTPDAPPARRAASPGRRPC